eukprot:jgi/Mesvir1/11963/Mv00283-RA.1
MLAALTDGQGIWGAPAASSPPQRNWASREATRLKILLMVALQSVYCYYLDWNFAFFIVHVIQLVYVSSYSAITNVDPRGMREYLVLLSDISVALLHACETTNLRATPVVLSFIGESGIIASKPRLAANDLLLSALHVAALRFVMANEAGGGGSGPGVGPGSFVGSSGGAGGFHGVTGGAGGFSVEGSSNGWSDLLARGDVLHTAGNGPGSMGAVPRVGVV